MVVGIKKIVGRITMGDEYGVYRQTEDGYEYLLFITTTYNDLLRRGKDLAKYFGVKFENKALSPEDPEAEEKKEQEGGLKIKSVPVPAQPELMNALNTLLPENKNQDPWIQPMLDHQDQKSKPRRVSGVAKKVKPLIAEGKTDEEIFQIMLPDYQNVGRSEKQARELLLPYLKDIRAGKI